MRLKDIDAVSKLNTELQGLDDAIASLNPNHPRDPRDTRNTHVPENTTINVQYQPLRSVNWESVRLNVDSQVIASLLAAKRVLVIEELAKLGVQV